MHIPLDLEINIDGSRIRFVGLDKLREHQNEIYLLETDNLKLHPISFKTGNLEDVLLPNILQLDAGMKAKER
ncbi:MAG: hypothetical protein AABW83_02565 [Nanoarchaeota archaeon]